MSILLILINSVPVLPVDMETGKVGDEVGTSDNAKEDIHSRG
jgi:hypothetical protein